MEYRITESQIMVGWSHRTGFCAHWYISRRGIGAEVGTIVPGGESVLLLDYDTTTNKVSVLVAGSHRHGGSDGVPDF
jgi:hypothetical protein